jgi:hypothetical protein
VDQAGTGAGVGALGDEFESHYFTVSNWALEATMKSLVIMALSAASGCVANYFFHVEPRLPEAGMPRVDKQRCSLGYRVNVQNRSERVVISGREWPRTGASATNAQAA